MPPHPDNRGRGSGSRATYRVRSRRPLMALVFLAPLILVVEILLARLVATDRVVALNRAHEWLLGTLERIGLATPGGVALGGLAIVATLLGWHGLRRDPWRLRLLDPPKMLLECVVLALPLVLLGAVLAPPGGVLSSPPLAALDMPNRIVVALGGALHEELLFRVGLLGLVHGVLVSLGRAPRLARDVVFIVGSTAAFAWYHDPGSLAVAATSYHLLAGAYLAGLLPLRGYGIVVGVHVLANVLPILQLAASG